MVTSLTCSRLHRREITVQNCQEADPEDCKRIYHIVVPRILCRSGGRRRLGENEYFEGRYKRVGTLPLVFALHAYKKDATSMEAFIPFAEDSHFVLVLPEGKDYSFNGGDCCGAAMRNNIHDVEFLAYLKQSLTNEFEFLHPSLTYGIGWNNGAFLLTYASQQVPNLFRAIVPIAGYTHRLQEMVNDDIGIMMHFSIDDTETRPSGCCDNPNLPACNGEVMSDWCVSILQFFDLWAKEVDQCSINGIDATDGFENQIVSNNDGIEYSLSYRDDATVFELTPNATYPQTVDLLFESKLPMKLSYHDEGKGVTCLTVTSASCVSNSTLCLYTRQGDFRPDFSKSFFMYDEVMNYIATDACEIDGGEMVSVPGNSSKRQCACEITPGDEEEFGGTFCFDALKEDGTFKPKEIAPVAQLVSTRQQTRTYVFGVMFVTIFTVILLTIWCLKKRRFVERKGSERQIYDHCDHYRQYMNSSTFRDFDRRDTQKVSNVKKRDGVIGNDSEHSEHASPLRYRDQTRATANDMDTTEWVDNHSMFLSSIIKATEMAEVKRDFSRERGDSLEGSLEGSVDDCLSFEIEEQHQPEYQPPWEAFPREKLSLKERKPAKPSKNKGLSQSLMHVINAPTSYLDSSDRQLLRKYRQQQKGNGVEKAIRGGGVSNALFRKDSAEPHNTFRKSVEPQNMPSSLDGYSEASLSNDLELIESSMRDMGTIT